MFPSNRNLLSVYLLIKDRLLHITMQSRLYQNPHHYVLGLLPFPPPLACDVLHYFRIVVRGFLNYVLRSVLKLRNSIYKSICCFCCKNLCLNFTILSNTKGACFSNFFTVYSIRYSCPI